MREAGGRLPAAALEVLRRAAPCREGPRGAFEAGRLPPLRRLEPARGEATVKGRRRHACRRRRGRRAVSGPLLPPRQHGVVAAQIGVDDDSFHGGGGEVRHDLLLLDARTAAD